MFPLHSGPLRNLITAVDCRPYLLTTREFTRKIYGKMERGIFRSSQRFQREPSHHIVEADEIFSVATTSAARYVSDSSAENTVRLDESLNDLIRFISDVEKAFRLSWKNRSLKEFLAYTPVILNASTTSIVTRSKFYRLLFNIAHHNIPLRRYMAGELRLLGSVFSCLKASLKEQLGPQNMIDILRLIQVLSYEKNVPLEHWANELISFLMGEVIREPEPEWMPYCIAILCNLASSSKSACKRIKISTSYKKFNRQLMKLLQHEARIIVVSSLVLIGYLDEKVRDMVYCPENVHDTFMCTFNVLTIGDDDCMMTRQIAADLLRRLVVSESHTQVPTLASTGKNVLNYGFFLSSVQQTARLLVTLNPRTEEAAKVYDLLLAFCSLQELRSAVCQAVVRCDPTESQLTTPLMAITEAAALPLEDAVNGYVPLKALKMLSYLFNEIIEPHELLAPEIPIAQFSKLLTSSVRTIIDPNSEDVCQTSQRLQYGLRLAAVAGRDEDCRGYLLGICTASLCNQIANWQFVKNPVVVHLTKAPRDRTEPLEPWTMPGIGIILELCRLLAVLKDHSKVHKDQYWQLLKDERIIPFLAYAVCNGDKETVQTALTTYSHCMQVAAFPIHMLSEMIASCKTDVQKFSDDDKKRSQSTEDRSRNDAFERPCSVEPDEKSQKALDELLKRVSLDGSSVKDAKTSELFSAYERKIQMLQIRERDLESLVRAREEALVQSEKLRHTRAENHRDIEISKIREMTQECESLREQNKLLSDHIEATKSEFDRYIAKNVQENDQLKNRLSEATKTAELYLATYQDLEEKLNLCQAEKITLGTKLDNAYIQIGKAEQDHQTEVLKLNADLAQNVARLELFLNENKEIKRSIDEKTVECESLKAQIADAEAQLLIKRNELEHAHAQTSNAEQRVAAKELELVSTEKQLKLYMSRLSEKEREYEAMELVASSLRLELEDSQKKMQALETIRESILSLAARGH